MRAVRSRSWSWTLLAAVAGGLGAQDVPSRLSIHPSHIHLDSPAARHSFVVVAVDGAGIARDVTGEARLTMSAEDVARVEDGHWRGLRDGKVELTAHWAGATAGAVIEVRNAAADPPASFRNDVIPVLTRAGCNAGACHGSAAGKNGFHLSLFGYDPAADHRSLTREFHGRRVDVGDPDQSLMLAKPTRQVQHEGGKRLDRESELFARLRTWIAEGARDDGEQAASLERLVVQPDDVVLRGAGSRLQLVVTAHYSDGTVRDVTRLSLISTSSETVVAVDSHGAITSGARGEAFVLARFDSLAEVAQVIVLPEAAGTEPAWPDVPAFNEIDEEIHAKLRKLRLSPADLCDDFTFVRRVYLDVLGVLPTPEEVSRLVSDEREDKRALLVDELLERPEFPEVWAAQWTEVLRVEPSRLREKGVHVYSRYLREAFRDRVPFDQLVRALLTSKGSNFENPASSFYVVERDAKIVGESVAQTFLGIRVQCAQCHNHPFERWTMDDYYGFVAFFAQVGRKTGEDPREVIVYDRRGGEVRNARNGQVAPPRFLGGAEPEIPRGKDRREVLADWLTSPDNPYFAANVANRVWARFFGRGLVEPVDDFRVSNPPSHPALFERLGRELAASGFDLRVLVRMICTSRTYQLAVHADAPPAATFAGANVRRLGAEQMLDAIGRVTGVETRLRGVPAGASAVRAIGGNPGNRFLDLFGRPRRTSVCACERRDEPTLNQVLHLINGETIERKIADRNGQLAQSLAAKREPRAMLDELFLSAYARPPRPGEAESILQTVHEAGDSRQVWQDVYWAVLNSKEFLFQH